MTYCQRGSVAYVREHYKSIPEPVLVEAFHTACCYRNSDVAHFLAPILANANPGLHPDEITRIFDILGWADYADIATLFLERFMIPESAITICFIDACRYGHPGIAQVLKKYVRADQLPCDIICHAADRGNMELINLLLEITGGDFLCGMSAVFMNVCGDYCTESRRGINLVNIAKFLLEKNRAYPHKNDGDRINITDSGYLLRACELQCVAMVQFLLASAHTHTKKISQPDPDPDGKIISVVYESGNYKIFQLLLNAGVDPRIHDEETLVRASRGANPKILRWLLNAGVNRAQKNRAILESGGYEDKISRLLIGIGADHRANNDDLLTRMICRNNIPAVRFLLQSGADPRASGKSKKQNVGFCYACENGSVPIVRLLLGLDENDLPTPDWSTWNREGFSNACGSRSVKLVELFLKLGMTPVVSDLNIACKSGRLENIRVLIKSGVNPGADNNSAMFDVINSRLTNRDLMMRLLIKHGADPRANNNEPLRLAIKKDDEIIFRVLMEYGVLPDKP